jgi:hypothetical protein
VCTLWSSFLPIFELAATIFLLNTELKQQPHKHHHHSSSSSSGSTTSVIECFGLLNDFLPFVPVLDAVLPIIYFHGIEIILTSFSHLVWGLTNDLIAMGFQSYTFFTILSSGIL